MCCQIVDLRLSAAIHVNFRTCGSALSRNAQSHSTTPFTPKSCCECEPRGGGISSPPPQRVGYTNGILENITYFYWVTKKPLVVLFVSLSLSWGLAATATTSEVVLHGGKGLLYGCFIDNVIELRVHQRRNSKQIMTMALSRFVDTLGFLNYWFLELSN
jgi:hypothetical protein